MKPIIISFFLMVYSFCLQAQIITVLNQETETPLAHATLTSINPRTATITNTKGEADISLFEGSEEIEVRAVGFKPLLISYEEIQEADHRIALSPSKINLDEVVVSATRWNQKTSEISSKIVPISPKSIRLQNPQTAADLLGISGKVFIQKSQQGGGSPMIRGFSTNRLLYTIDGVRMNTAIFRGGNLQNVISLDPFALEHVEVLFGPGSVIYGSDAIGGIMSFRTLTPEFSLSDKTLVSGKAAARYSSANNEKTAHFDVNIGWKKWAMITSFSTFDYGHLRMGSHGPAEYLRPFYVERIDSTDVVIRNPDPRVQRPSGYSQINMMQKIRYSPSQEWDLEYGFHYSETSDYDRYDRHIRTRNGLPRYAEWYYGPQIWMMNNLSIARNCDKLFYDRMSVRLTQQHFEESRISRDLNDPRREFRIEEVDAYSANIDMIKSTNRAHKFFYGLEVVNNGVNSTGTNENIIEGTSEPGPSRYPKANWGSYAAYLSGHFLLTRPLTLQTGLRYNQFLLDATFDTTFYPFPFDEAHINDGALTGSLGLVYRPSDQWVFSLGVSTAFRSPNVDDLGKVFDSEPGAVTVPNPGLEAEYAYNADLSIVKVFDEILKVDVAAFYTLLDNALVRRDFTLDSRDSILYDGELSRVQALQNAAVAHVYGIQGGIELKLPSGFGISSDINYQKGTEELDDGSTSPSRHAPPWFGVSRISYSASKLSLQFYANYSGEKRFEDMPDEEKEKDYMYAVDADGNPYAPSWYTLNVKAMYQLTSYLVVSAGLENITDRRYRPYSSGLVAPGRNFILSMQAAF